MLPPKVRSLLGLSRRAGALATGDWAVTMALRRKAAQVVLLAGDAGGATQRRFIGLCKREAVTLFRVASRSELGAAIGMEPKAVLAVTASNFSSGVVEGLIQSGFSPEGGGDLSPG